MAQKHPWKIPGGQLDRGSQALFGLALVQNARESSKQAAGRVQSQKSAAVKIMVKNHKKFMSEHVFAIRSIYQASEHVSEARVLRSECKHAGGKCRSTYEHM